MRRARERDVPLAGQQARGRIEADPARAGQIHLGPGVQVREVALGARRPVERLHVGDELDQVARNESARQSQVPQDVDEQPPRIAARAGAELQRLLGLLYARLHADRVADVALQALVQVDEEVDRPRRRLVAHRLSHCRTRRPAGSTSRYGSRSLRRAALVDERNLLRLGLQEKVERITHGHVGDEIDVDEESRHLLGKHDAREEIAVRILLPVQKVAFRLDAQRVAQHGRAAVRRGPQANDLRPHLHGAVVLVMSPVVQGDVERHELTAERRNPRGRRRRLLPLSRRLRLRL